MALPDPDRSRVVLIGTSRFTDTDLPDLPAVRNNLDGLAACLRDIGRCTVVADPASIEALVDPIHDAAAQAEDTLLIYYAGHGLIHPRTLGLLLAVVGSAPGRTHTAVPYDLVRENVLDSPATRKVVILDCCYSGRALGGMADPTTALANEATVEGTYLLASAPPNKQALSPPGETYTAFTGALLTLFNEGVPNGPPLLQLDLIYRRVRDALKRAARPEPQLRADNTAGELALVRNPWHQTVFEPLPDLSTAKPVLRERLKELVRGTGLDTPYACPVCDITVTGQKLVRHFDKHSAAQTAALNPATLTLTPRPVLFHDRYQLGKPIKGTGDVLRSVDTVTKHRVLIQQVPNDRIDDRWLRLDHPAIVRLLDIAADHIVWEYVDGRTVRDILRSTGPMAPDRAAEIAIEVCGGLGYLHGQGLVHGDLGDCTVMLTRDGAVKMLTYDLGDPSSPSSDIYATGCLLIDLLTGMSSTVQLLTSFLKSPAAAEIPPALDKVIRTAMRPNTATRYQTAFAMRDDLIRALQQ